MILAGLLDALFKRQVILIATSNIEPDRLYEDGLQRQRFLARNCTHPEIHSKLLRSDSGADYRLRSLAQATLYHCPISQDTDGQLMGLL